MFNKIRTERVFQKIDFPKTYPFYQLIIKKKSIGIKVKFFDYVVGIAYGL